MEQKRKYKRCNLCARDIHHSLFFAHLESNNHLLKTGDTVSCEICKSVSNSDHDYENHFLSEEHHANTDLTAHLRKVWCEK